MIAYLQGVFTGTRDQAVILDVHGVGYLVEVSARLLSQLPASGKLFPCLSRRMCAKINFACSALTMISSGNGLNS